MQKTFFLFILLSENDIPKERHVGKAGGTLIVTRSNNLIITSFCSISPLSYLSRKVLIETMKDKKATKKSITMNFPESLEKES